MLHFGVVANLGRDLQLNWKSTRMSLSQAGLDARCPNKLGAQNPVWIFLHLLLSAQSKLFEA